MPEIIVSKQFYYNDGFVSISIQEGKQQIYKMNYAFIELLTF